MLLRLFLVLLAVGLFADEATLSDTQRVAVAVAQRDMLIRKAQYEQALEKARSATADAQAFCLKSGKAFDENAIACIAK